MILLLCGCLCSLYFPHSAVGWSAAGCYPLLYRLLVHSKRLCRKQHGHARILKVLSEGVHAALCNSDVFFCLFVCLFFVDEGREDPNTT